MDPDLYAECARQWRAQAEGVEEFALLAKRRVLDRLEDWTGPAAKAGKHRIGTQVVQAFGDAPERARMLAVAYDHAGRRFATARRLAREAEEDAAAHDLQISAAGEVLRPVSALPLAPEHGIPLNHVQPRHAQPEAATMTPIQAKADRALRLARQADEELARAIPAICEGLPWEGDDPDVLSAREAAELLREAATGDQAAFRELQRHRDLFDDPYFAQELATLLGGDGFAELPALMARQRSVDGWREDDVIADNRHLLGMLSDTLATATDPDNPAWQADPGSCQDLLRDLKTAGRSDHQVDGGRDYPGYWAYDQILGATDGQPPYSEQFLDQVGNDMVAWERELRHDPSGALPQDTGPFGDLGGSPTGEDRTGSQDVLDGLMHAAGTNGEGAQAIFGHGDNLEYLLAERAWSDRGDDVGIALEAATVLQNADAREIASEATSVIGGRLAEDHEFGERIDNMADSLGRMVGYQISDIGYVIDPEFRPEQHYDQRSLAELIRFAAGDKDGYQAMIVAETQDAGEKLSYQARDGDVGAAAAESRHAGRVLGFIVDAHTSGMEEEALRKDAENGALADTVNKALGIIPTSRLLKDVGEFGGNIVALARNEATDAATTAMFRTDHLQEVRQVSADHNEQIKEVVRDMARRGLIENPQLIADQADPALWTNSELYYDPVSKTLLDVEQMSRNGITELDNALRLDEAARGPYAELYGAIDSISAGQETFKNYIELRFPQKG